MAQVSGIMDNILHVGVSWWDEGRELEEVHPAKE